MNWNLSSSLELGVGSWEWRSKSLWDLIFEKSAGFRPQLPTPNFQLPTQTMPFLLKQTTPPTPPHKKEKAKS